MELLLGQKNQHFTFTSAAPWIRAAQLENSTTTFYPSHPQTLFTSPTVQSTLSLSLSLSWSWVLTSLASWLYASVGSLSPLICMMVTHLPSPPRVSGRAPNSVLIGHLFPRHRDVLSSCLHPPKAPDDLVVAEALVGFVFCVHIYFLLTVSYRIPEAVAVFLANIICSYNG